MLEFIQLIKQRYQTVLAQLDKKSSRFNDYQQQLEQLLYAEAFLQKGRLIESRPKFPLQIAVIGPTQAGKSSIVNLLLKTSLAGVSPLAGYTVHPHAYCHDLQSAGLATGLQDYFGRFQCLEQAMLSHDRLDCFSLAEIGGRSPLLPACVCWDTPDFDSIDAADYREGVIRTIALADIVVLVVSKEKYADQSVWEVMKTIAGFQQPTLICVNKLSEGSETEILQSLQQKWRQHRQDPLPDMVPLMFHKLDGIPAWPASAGQALFKLAKKVAHAKQPQHSRQFLQHYWRHWLEPVYAEHHAQRSWQVLVDQCIAQGLANYKRDYLEHPHHYQTFQHAVLNMLNLLEIPGTARFIGKARRVMTWPVRTLFSLGRESVQDNPVHEVAVLQQIGEHVLILLADKLLEKNETESQPAVWWKEAAVMLRQHRSEILHAYSLAVADYHRHFQQDVEAAAHRLYHKLQEQPLILNSLRATRATTDAAALLLSIQAGGIGLHDLVLTPIMLTASSLLAESAIGSYMGRVEAELKQHQFATVKRLLFEQGLRGKLDSLPQHSTAANRFNISESQCQQAEQALKEKKHGLRLL